MSTAEEGVPPENTNDDSGWGDPEPLTPAEAARAELEEKQAAKERARAQELLRPSQGAGDGAGDEGAGGEGDAAAAEGGALTANTEAVEAAARKQRSVGASGFPWVDTRGEIHPATQWTAFYRADEAAQARAEAAREPEPEPEPEPQPPAAEGPGSDTPGEGDEQEDFAELAADTFGEIDIDAIGAIDYGQLRKWISDKMKEDETIEAKRITDEMRTASRDAFDKHQRESDTMLSAEKFAPLLQELGLEKYVDGWTPKNAGGSAEAAEEVLSGRMGRYKVRVEALEALKKKAQELQVDENELDERLEKARQGPPAADAVDEELQALQAAVEQLNEQLPANILPANLISAADADGEEGAGRAAAQGRVLSPGTAVLVEGLQKAPLLNGCAAVVESFHSDWSVRPACFWHPHVPPRICVTMPAVVLSGSAARGWQRPPSGRAARTGAASARRCRSRCGLSNR